MNKAELTLALKPMRRRHQKSNRGVSVAPQMDMSTAKSTRKVF